MTRNYTFLGGNASWVLPVNGKIIAVSMNAQPSNSLISVDFLFGATSTSAMGAPEVSAAGTATKGGFAQLTCQHNTDVANFTDSLNGLNVPVKIGDVVNVIVNTGTMGGTDRVNIYLET